MKVLILGGTVFLGRHLVTSGVERGHEITIFNRGRHTPEGSFPEVEQLRGDRDEEVGLFLVACRRGIRARAFQARRA